jgi:hypothetical protein
MSAEHTELDRRPRQLARTVEQALLVLHPCPFLPVDVFAQLMGLHSFGSAYKQLARLRQAGMAEVRRVDAGFLVCDRRIGLWSITQRGLAVQDAIGLTDGCKDVYRVRVPGPTEVSRQGRPNMALRVAAYRLLGAIVAEARRDARPVQVVAWESPWRRTVWSGEQEKWLDVNFPAGAAIAPHTIAVGPSRSSNQPTQESRATLSWS